MKNKKIFLMGALCLGLLTGCANYEKDTSYDTELPGTYIQSLGDKEIGYLQKDTITVNNDNTFNEVLYELNGKKEKENTISGKLEDINNVTSDVIEFSLDNSRSLFKYKNMLGYYYDIDIPKGNTFDLYLHNDGSNLDEGQVFDKNGNYHYCIHHDNCNDDSSQFVKYKKKGDIIYTQSANGNWFILYYVVDNKLFSKSYVKEK
nr:hypothetical protein [Clostridium sp. Marseille-P7770]